MTPAEHYRKAESLVQGHLEVLEETKRRMDANHRLDGKDAAVALQMASSLLMQAQIHATLATADKDTYFEANQL